MIYRQARYLMRAQTRAYEKLPAFLPAAPLKRFNLSPLLIQLHDFNNRLNGQYHIVGGYILIPPVVVLPARKILGVGRPMYDS